MAKKLANNSRPVIVSGGSRGVGLELCRALLQSGYLVSTFSRKATAELNDLKEQYGEAFWFGEVDIEASEQVRKFVFDASERFGPVWALVNNAAVVRDGIFATLPEVEISRMLSINLEGTMRLTRHCLRNMLTTSSGGRVINISSIVGSRGYNGLAVYSATKAALDGLTRSLARELGRRSITVNSVAPGYMKTAMSAGLDEGGLDQIVRRTPLGRLAEISDIIPLVEFLLSDRSSFITGQTILVDGGISI